MLLNRIVADLGQTNVKIERFIFWTPLTFHHIWLSESQSPPQNRNHVQTEARGAERPLRSREEHAAEEADEGAPGRLRLQRVPYVGGPPVLALSEEQAFDI